jgi:hypothetical protein
MQNLALPTKMRFSGTNGDLLVLLRDGRQAEMLLKQQRIN